MRRIFTCGAAALAVSAASALAQLQNAVEVCGNPKAEPRDIVHFCRMALDTGKLDALAAAQVSANLGVGYFELGHYDQAVKAYTAAIASAPDMVAAYVNRARAYERIGQPNEAAADYSKAIELDSRAADAWLGRGVLMLRHGRTEQAIDDFGAAVRVEPNWPAARFNLGIAYLETGAFAEAAGLFSDVIERDPGDAAAWASRGRARAGMGDAQAEADFDRAIQLDPESGSAWFARGKYFDERGAREAANADFLRAYELGYADPWLIQRVREISG
jgi:Tfp pilus assembly protein PilF